ncbi:hypothetical protein GCM10010394_44290 [Streptomyces crystallinus]|uniref:Uncharacterized protein n=1 Tax=Streptomyces crystallinus TaxID=68191 RepID=A0ABN1GDZ7_9ACTN
MIRVVEEKDEVTQADEGVGAVAGLRQALGVSVHIADHMYSHGATLGRRTCGYFRVAKGVDYCARSGAKTM